MYLDIFPEVSWLKYSIIDGYSTQSWLPCTLTGNYHLTSIDKTATAYFEVIFSYTYYIISEDTRTFLDKITGVPRQKQQMTREETKWFSESEIRIRTVDRRKFNVEPVENLKENI